MDETLNNLEAAKIEMNNWVIQCVIGILVSDGFMLSNMADTIQSQRDSRTATRLWENS